MEQLSDIFQNIIDFILGNIGIVIFAIFLLSGLIGRGNKGKEQQTTTERKPARPIEHDDRPLAERLAEYFGVEIPDGQPQPAQQQEQKYASEGRRSTTRRNVQENYPELFGGNSLFDRTGEDAEPTKWGFDETEWGSTFVKNDDQWGKTFPDHKDSEPRIEWPR